jgi:hypothetical protein
LAQTETGVTVGDCRSETGITVGLIDGIIAVGRVLVHRDWSDPAIVEALADLRADEDIQALISPEGG